MTAPTLIRTRRRSTLRQVPDLAVQPYDALRAIHAGKPLVVDVDKRGSGWWLIAVGTGTYTVYRNTVTATVSWAEVRVR